MNPNNIEWRDIRGYEGLYQVSELGQVRCLERVYYCGDKHSMRIQEEKVMQPTSVKGYLRISLSKNGARASFLVHRLVAEAFLPIPQNLICLRGTRRLQINHKDENIKNNSVSNLEWCNASYNVNYGERNRKMAEKNRNGKKSKPILCVETGVVYPSQAEIQRRFGFAQGNISACCKRMGTSYGLTWRYANE